MSQANIRAPSDCKRIAIFGLSGNPPTGLHGHQGIVRLLSRSALFDEIWVLPVYEHILSTKRHLLIDFAHRMHMCRLAFEEESTPTCIVRVLELEKDVREYYLQHFGPEFRVGTVDVLEYLQKVDCVAKSIGGENVCHSFVLASDAVHDMAVGKWKNVQRILELATLAVLERAGHKHCDAVIDDFIATHPSRVMKIDMDDLELGDVSSTMVRNLLKDRREADIDSNMLNPEVKQYIVENALFS